MCGNSYMTQNFEDHLDNTFDGDWTAMAGTDETWKYTVLAGTELGRIGVRDLGSSMRVRVEPLNGYPLEGLTREAGWKQPGDNEQERYSTVASSGMEAKAAVQLALQALGVDLYETVYNEDVPDWAHALMADQVVDSVGELVSRMKADAAQMRENAKAEIGRLEAEAQPLVEELDRFQRWFGALLKLGVLDVVKVQAHIESLRQQIAAKSAEVKKASQIEAAAELMEEAYQAVRALGYSVEEEPNDQILFDVVESED